MSGDLLNGKNRIMTFLIDDAMASVNKISPSLYFSAFHINQRVHCFYLKRNIFKRVVFCDQIITLFNSS